MTTHFQCPLFLQALPDLLAPCQLPGPLLPESRFLAPALRRRPGLLLGLHRGRLFRHLPRHLRRPRRLRHLRRLRRPRCLHRLLRRPKHPWLAPRCPRRAWCLPRLRHPRLSASPSHPSSMSTPGVLPPLHRRPRPLRAPLDARALYRLHLVM
jgi:hypothetical protein